VALYHDGTILDIYRTARKNLGKRPWAIDHFDALAERLEVEREPGGERGRGGIGRQARGRRKGPWAIDHFDALAERLVVEREPGGERGRGRLRGRSESCKREGGG
jgi:hypothetical protein